MANLWSAVHDGILINFYKGNEILWNVKHTQYYKRDLRENLLNDICNLLGLNRDGHPFTGSDCKDRFKNLRAVFHREHKKVQQSIKSGCGLETVYVPRWSYYNDMLFLKDVCTIRANMTKEIENQTRTASPTIKSEILCSDICPSLDDIIASDDTDQSSNLAGQIEQHVTPWEKNGKKRKYTTDSREELLNEVLKILKDPTERRSTTTLSADEYFLLSLAPALTSLDGMNKALAKMEFQQVLLKYQFNINTHVEYTKSNE